MKFHKAKFKICCRIWWTTFIFVKLHLVLILSNKSYIKSSLLMTGQKMIDGILLRFLRDTYLIFLTLVQLLHQKDNKSKNKSNGKISILQIHPYVIYLLDKLKPKTRVCFLYERPFLSLHALNVKIISLPKTQSQRVLCCVVCQRVLKKSDHMFF